LNASAQKAEAYLRVQRHVYPKQKYGIPKASQEAQLWPCLRKRKVAAKGTAFRKVIVKSMNEANEVEVITSAQEPLLASEQDFLQEPLSSRL
jgi:hypothetical protein